jgi:hypothetical protein
MLLFGRRILTHISSSTRVVFQTKVVYQAKFFPSKQDVYQVGLIPKRAYTEVPLYFSSPPTLATYFSNFVPLLHLSPRNCWFPKSSINKILHAIFLHYEVLFIYNSCYMLGQQRKLFRANLKFDTDYQIPHAHDMSGPLKHPWFNHLNYRQHGKSRPTNYEAPLVRFSAVLCLWAC